MTLAPAMTAGSPLRTLVDWRIRFALLTLLWGLSLTLSGSG